MHPGLCQHVLLGHLARSRGALAWHVCNLFFFFFFFLEWLSAAEADDDDGGAGSGTGLGGSARNER